MPGEGQTGAGPGVQEAGPVTASPSERGEASARHRRPSGWLLSQHGSLVKSAIPTQAQSPRPSKASSRGPVGDPEVCSPI